MTAEPAPERCKVCGFVSGPGGCENFDCPGSAPGSLATERSAFEQALSDAFERAFGPGTISKLELGEVRAKPKRDPAARAQVERTLAGMARDADQVLWLTYPLAGASSACVVTGRLGWAGLALTVLGLCLLWRARGYAVARTYRAHWRSCRDCREILGDPDQPASPGPVSDGST